MHFQHPELLYSLFLLVIPLVVHLFRLRKFKKEDFTNVKFLRKVIQETRKSSELKRFLILCTRILLLACIVIAFAKPFIPTNATGLKNSETIIYLDNSFSMQARTNKTTLLDSAIDDLLQNLSDNEEIKLVTNNQQLDGTFKNLKDQLQELTFSSNPLNFNEMMLKVKELFNASNEVEKDLVVISDFVTQESIPDLLKNDGINYHLIQYDVENFQNLSIDSAYISSSNPETIHLNVLVSGKSSGITTISIRNGERLLGRSSLDMDENTSEIEFRLQNEQLENGVIELEDSGLDYDNRLFFSISEREPIKIAIISDTENEFLNRIFSEPEFETQVFESSQVDFNSLNSANFIIINEPEEISASLRTNIVNARNNGASLLLIPSENAQSINNLFVTLGLRNFGPIRETEKRITRIEYAHPLLQNIFESTTQNFDYPNVLRSYTVNSSNPVLKFEDGSTFLAGSDQFYFFTSPLNSENSNFKSSPLLVSILYEMGLKSLRVNQLYYKINSDENIDISFSLSKDDVLKLKASEEEYTFIPQQQIFSNKVSLNISGLELKAGNYEVQNKDLKFNILSLNYPRTESKLDYPQIDQLENVETYNSVEEYYSKLNAASENNALWKWFIIFALIFLILEMLLIKFFK